MRLLVLTARPELDTNRRLVEACRCEGVEAAVVDATRVCAHAGAASALRYGDDDLLDPVPDAVLARVGNWRPESLLAALELAIAAGSVTPNPPAAIRAGRDHWLTVLRLRDAGLPVPATLAGADPEELAASAVASLGLPVVVKQRRSRMGVGVIRCATRDHLESVLDSLWRVGDEVVVQAYVPADGASLRLLVVGGEVVAAARFRATPGDWRSNAARGGTSETYRPGPDEQDLAVVAASALDLDVCGVDLLPCEAGCMVCEVNPTPGFRRLEETSGVDVARAIVRHTVALAQNRG